ncbi:MAG: hypothetical protein HC896_11305 [Bacteroidales bacterium]|nr:hypothetical protein [Bacteroidales bacterium]
MPRLYRIAAIFLIGLLAFAGHYVYNNFLPTTWASANEVLQVDLPDGSLAVLNRGSQLKH